MTDYFSSMRDMLEEKEADLLKEIRLSEGDLEKNLGVLYRQMKDLEEAMTSGDTSGVEERQVERGLYTEFDAQYSFIKKDL